VASNEERLRGRRLPTQCVRLPVDPDVWARLHRDHAAAVWALEDARARGKVDTGPERAAVAQLDAAIAAAEVVEVHLRALPPDEWESLVVEHPPTPDELARGAQWHVPTFRPALLAASEAAAGHPATDWERLAKEGEITAGELASLFESSIMLNVRMLSDAVGKGR
jgi:hypothetical protein